MLSDSAVVSGFLTVPEEDSESVCSSLDGSVLSDEGMRDLKC